MAEATAPTVRPTRDRSQVNYADLNARGTTGTDAAVTRPAKKAKSTQESPLDTEDSEVQPSEDEAAGPSRV